MYSLVTNEVKGDDMKNKNSKGFSLVEILAAIVILGLLSSIAIVSVNYILNKAETEYYKSQKEQIINAAKSYTQDNRNSLPKRVGMRTEITLNTLQTKKYIGKVVDRHKRECNKDKTIVQVYKYDKTHYSYSVTLVCPSYTKDKNNDNINQNSNIDIHYYVKENKDGINYKETKATITMSDIDKIASYNYIVYRNGTEVKNSGDVEGKLQETITITVPLEKYLPGNIEIKVVVTDYYGNQKTKNVTKSIVSKNAPKCDVISGANKDWTNTNTPPIEISVKCNSYSNKGCQKDIYTQQFNSSTEKGNIEMVDKEGNPGVCEVDVYLDMEPPSQPVITNKYNNIWTNKNYTIEITSVDEISGIDHFEYRYPNSTLLASDGKLENEWHSWENSSKEPNDNTPFETTEFSRQRNEVLEVRAVDKAGNYSEVSTTIIKIDKTAPEIQNINNLYLNTWFNKAMYNQNNSAYVISITSQDVSKAPEKNATGISGISYHQYKYPNSDNNWVKYDNSGNVDEATNREPFTFNTTPFKKERDEKVSFQVCDRAGNCTEGESYIKIDRTAPSITITNPYANTWFNKSAYNSNNNAFKISSKATDAISGLASHNYKHSDESSWTKKQLSSTKSDTISNLGPYKTNMNKTLSFEACDTAGNCNTNSTNIKVDITPPSCSVPVSPGSPNGSNGWYTTTPTINLSTSDSGGSGVSQYGLGTSSNVSYNNRSSATQSDTKGTTWYGKVKDVAGNTASCSSSTLKVDTTAPRCSVSVSGTKGNSNWYTSKPKLTLSHSDGYSGVSCYGLGTSSNVTCGSTDSGTQSSDTKGTTWYGIVKDNAGNVANCNSGSIKVDTTAPSTPTYTSRYSDGSGSYTSGTKADRTVETTISATDGGSGIEVIYSNSNSGLLGKSSLTQNGSTWSGKVTWHFTGGKNDNYQFRARDVAGNLSGWSSTFNIKYVKTYTVSYNANGGTGAPSKQQKKEGVALTLSTTKPTRSGYTFLGWATSSSASAARYGPGGLYTTNSDTTLYAVWQQLDSINANRCYNGNKYHITTCSPSICNYDKLNGNASNGTVARNNLSVCSVTLNVSGTSSSAMCSGRKISLTCTAKGGVTVTATIVDNGYTTTGTGTGTATAYATLNTTRNGNILTTYTCKTNRGDTKTSSAKYTVKSCSSGGGSTCSKTKTCIRSARDNKQCREYATKANGWSPSMNASGDCHAIFCKSCPSGWISYL